MGRGHEQPTLWRYFRLFSPLAVLLLLIAFSSSMSYSAQDIRPFINTIGFEWIEMWFGWVQFNYGSGEVSVAHLGIAGFVEFFVRKGMHLLAFALLAFLLYRLFRGLDLKVGVRIALALLSAVGFAFMDEVRQFYHPERSGMWQDVVLDGVGALLGVAVAYWFYRRKKSSP